MAELKTKKTAQSVDAFINAIPDEHKRADAFAIVEILKKITKAGPKMWGNAIIGFGDRTLKYDSGRELDWFTIGFSPRKSGLVLYMPGVAGKQKADLAALGKHKLSGSCVHIKTLADVDTAVLKRMVETYVKNLR